MGNRGFTLIEMSIVLVVIGLIIGGILKGQEMIESGREKSVMAEVERFRAASNTFTDKYGFLPGDYPRASVRVNAVLLNGDGNGRIAGPTNDAAKLAKAVWRGPENGALGNGSVQENVYFWSHLTSAGLMGQASMPGSTLTSDIFPTSVFPATHFEVSYAEGQLFGANDLPLGHYYRLSRWSIDSGGTVTMSGGVDTKVGMEIDLKFDDGHPFTGKVYAAQAGLTGSGRCANTSFPYYQLDEGDKACTLYFTFN